MSEKTYIGSKAAKLEDKGTLTPISRVTLFVDDDNYYTAGDDSGRTLEKTTPHATQAMADSILSAIKGYQHKPFEAQNALLDPAAELGDGVTVGGIYSAIGQMTVDFGPAYTVKISAPGSKEVDEEFGAYVPKSQREYNRKLAQTRSLITKTSEEIRLEVADDLNDLSASLDIQLDSIKADIEGLDGRTASLEMGLDGISAQVTDNTNAIAAIDLYVDSLTLSVSNGSTSSTISLKAGSTTIASQSISFSGVVTFSDLSTAGGTTINGSNITTGTLYADYIKLYGNLSVYTTKTGSTVGGYLGYTSSTLDGSAGIHIMNSGGTGEVRVTSNGAAMEAPGGAKIVCTSNCNVTGSYINLTSDNYIYLYAGSGSYEAGPEHFAPSSNSNRYCGLSGQRWSTVYCVAVNESSDRALKDNISYGIDKYDAFFDKLKPCSHTFVGDESKITHTRLVAQDVDNALADSGLSRSDFAGLCMSDVEGESGIVYSEFVSILIDQVQKLKSRVAVLEGKV